MWSDTLWSTQSWVTDAGVLVVAEMEKGGAAVPVQIDAFVHHSFYDVYSESSHEPLAHPKPRPPLSTIR